jgi:hypothetical protein
MAPPAAARKKIPPIALVTGLAVVVLLIVGLAYLNKPAAKPPDPAASPEAKAYLPHLELSDVRMQATENFMKQQVVEVQGKITNHGPRPLASVSVYCLFAGVDDREIHRERLPIIGPPVSRAPLNPNETRAFRLPFDSLPDGWNQAMPKFVVAQITFAK